MSDDVRWDAVDVLWDDDMDGLLVTLAARVQANEDGVAQEELEMWDAPERAFASHYEAGPEFTAKMKAFGERWWKKLEPQLYDLLCNKDNEKHDELMGALGKGAKELAVMLAPALLAPAVGLPAIAVVVATIAAKKILDTGLAAACEMWAESLEERAKEEEAESTSPET